VLEVVAAAAEATRSQQLVAKDTAEQFAIALP
jgi:hypothetical protein